jgi:hypothetical protein
MMTNEFSVFCGAMCAEQITVAQMLYNGVAFRYPGNQIVHGRYRAKPYYEVISHEGDYLGELTCFQVDLVYRALKKIGKKMGYIPGIDRHDEYSCGITLAWEGDL